MEGGPTTGASRHVITVCLGLVAAMHLLSLAYEPSLNHDAAQYLSAGRMLIDGALPYVDFVDTNPPMIVYLSAVPALLSAATGWPLATAGLLFFLAVVIATLALFLVLLARVAPGLQAWQRDFVALAWLASSLSTYQAGDFGQRDQLMMCTLAPFLLLRHARHAGIPVPAAATVAVALAASCGLALKPFYAVPLAFFEAVHWLRFRNGRALRAPEIAIAASLAGVYALHFLFVPGMSSFYGYWLDFMLRGYEAYDVGWPQVLSSALASARVWLLGLLALGLCLLPVWDRRPLPWLASCFGHFALISFGLYVAQEKGWHYQRLPFEQSAVIGAALALPSVRWPSSFPARVPVLAGLAAAIGLAAHPHPLRPLARLASQPPFAFPESPLTRTIESMTQRDQAVLFLDTSVAPAFPTLTYTGRPSGGRFLCTYPLAFFFAGSSDFEPAPGWSEEEELFYGWLLEDIETRRPELIFVSTWKHPQATAPYFSISEYLRRRGFYRAIPAYRRIGRVWGFEVLRRTGEG